MKLVLAKRGDGLLESACNDTCEALAAIGTATVFTTNGLTELDRTGLQNNYLWGWAYRHISHQLNECGKVIPCDDGTEIPYTADILHDWIFADRFRVEGIIKYKGKEKKLYESTAKMSKKRFIEYVEQIEQFAIQYWDIHVPATSRYESLF